MFTRIKKSGLYEYLQIVQNHTTNQYSRIIFFQRQLLIGI